MNSRVEILKSRGLDSAGTGAGSEAKLGQAATPMGTRPIGPGPFLALQGCSSSTCRIPSTILIHSMYVRLKQNTSIYVVYITC